MLLGTEFHRNQRPIASRSGMLGEKFPPGYLRVAGVGLHGARLSEKREGAALGLVPLCAVFARAESANTNGPRYWPISWVQIGSSGQARREARCGGIGQAVQRTRRADLPHRRPGAFGHRRCGSSREVSGTTARLAPIRQTEIAAVKSVNIYDRWYNILIIVQRRSTPAERENARTG